MSLQK